MIITFCKNKGSDPETNPDLEPAPFLCVILESGKSTYRPVRRPLEVNSVILQLNLKPTLTEIHVNRNSQESENKIVQYCTSYLWCKWCGVNDYFYLPKASV